MGHGGVVSRGRVCFEGVMREVGVVFEGEVSYLTPIDNMHTHTYTPIQYVHTLFITCSLCVCVCVCVCTYYILCNCAYLTSTHTLPPPTYKVHADTTQLQDQLTELQKQQQIELTNLQNQLNQSSNHSTTTAATSGPPSIA